jgi:hypothetical protein
MKISRSLASCICLLFLSIATAQAQESTHPRWDESFYINLGAYFLNADVQYGVTRTGEEEEEVDLDDLGIDDSSFSPLLELGWRFKPRWSLTTNFFRFDENGNLFSEEEFIIDGEVFPVGVALDSSVTVDTYILNLGYAFIQDQKKELGIGLGVHGFDFEAKVKGYAILGEETIPVSDDSQNFVAPLPNIRAFGRYAFNSRWHGTFEAGWLSADIDEYSGEMWLIDTSVEYRATEHLGIGAGYLWTDVNVDVEKNSKDEHYDLEFSGPMLYLSYSF